MPRQKRSGKRTAKYRFELLIPTSYNDGHPVETAKIQNVRHTLIAKFGGCRIQPAAPYQGWWVHQNQTYEDWLILFTVEGDCTEANLRWFETYKNQTLLTEFSQEEIYLAVSEVM
ncbi:hypothetical protein HYR99_14325 [Candidatus Poribacteria bacterium]|nr:hypothetical protein [Candidatus Poribacteria bacterium]